MINKFGREIKVIDLADVYTQIIEAKYRHLQHVRDRFRKYPRTDSVKDNTATAESMCLLTKWQLMKRKDKNDR